MHFWVAQATFFVLHGFLQVRKSLSTIRANMKMTWIIF